MLLQNRRDKEQLTSLVKCNEARVAHMMSQLIRTLYSRLSFTYDLGSSPMFYACSTSSQCRSRASWRAMLTLNTQPNCQCQKSDIVAMVTKALTIMFHYARSLRSGAVGWPFVDLLLNTRPSGCCDAEFRVDVRRPERSSSIACLFADDR